MRTVGGQGGGGLMPKCQIWFLLFTAVYATFPDLGTECIKMPFFSRFSGIYVHVGGGIGQVFRGYTPPNYHPVPMYAAASQIHFRFDMATNKV